MGVHSMTGFGRASVNNDGRDLSIEIKSVNHRFLDISVRTPKALSYLEDIVRICLQNSFTRGHFDVSVFYQNNRDDSKQVQADEALVNGYIGALKKIRHKYRLKNDIALSDVMKMNEVLKVVQSDEDQEAVCAMCEKAMDEASNMLLKMRKAEGSKLQSDLLIKLDRLENMLARVEARAPEAAAEGKEKLYARIKELLDGSEVDQQRLAQEAAYLADKAAIDEEIVRLHSHIQHVREMIESDGPAGRKLDFIIQEMNRETNTIGSKSGDLELTNLIIDMKSEIEKLREQVQNIE